MDWYNILRKSVPTLLFVASIIGTFVFSYLYVEDLINSPHWALLFALVGIVTFLFTIFDKKCMKYNRTKHLIQNINPIIIHIFDIIFYVGLALLLTTLITSEIRSFPYISPAKLLYTIWYQQVYHKS